MATARHKYEIDMCTGSLPQKILLFSLPLMATGMLQLLFNAADIIVVGRYVGRHALAAVGSNGSIINLIVNLFMGISIGGSAVIAQHYGAAQYEDVSEATHTCMLVGLISGFFVMVVGVVCTPAILRLMDTPDDVLPLAILYLRIYFLGMPGSMLYNFGAAVLRGVGDTRRPLIFLFFAGIVNVGLNLLLVIQFNLSVAGVGIATVVSQYISAALVLVLAATTSSSRSCASTGINSSASSRLAFPPGCRVPSSPSPMSSSSPPSIPSAAPPWPVMPPPSILKASFLPAAIR